MMLTPLLLVTQQSDREYISTVLEQYFCLPAVYNTAAVHQLHIDCVELDTHIVHVHTIAARREQNKNGYRYPPQPSQKRDTKYQNELSHG